MKTYTKEQSRKAYGAIHHYGLSCRAAAYVVDVFFPSDVENLVDVNGEIHSGYCAEVGRDVFTLTKKAREHLARNGGKPSEKASALLSHLQSLGTERAEKWVELWAEKKRLDDIRISAEVDSQMHDAKIKEWEKAGNPPQTEIDEKALKEGQEWWENEGKYEAELEDAGLIKSYFQECDRAAQFNEGIPTIKDFASENCR